MVGSKRSPKTPLRQFDYRVAESGRVLKPAEHELLAITAEDLIFARNLVLDGELDNPPVLRSISTLMRRLLLDGDIHKAAKILGWQEPLTVRTRVLVYDEPNPLVIVSCGHAPWGNARIPSMGSLLGSTSSKSRDDMEYEFRDEVEVSLKQLLNSLAFVVTGTKVTRGEVISYVSNKKAAHVSDSRHKPAHWILDHAWQGLTVTRIRDDGYAETISSVYLELAGIIYSVAESPSISRFIDKLVSTLSNLEIVKSPDAAKSVGLSLPISPTLIDRNSSD